MVLAVLAASVRGQDTSVCHYLYSEIGETGGVNSPR
jgi:hypothetical protein